MSLCALLMLSWLAGVALQLQQHQLGSAWVVGVALALALTCAGLAWRRGHVLAWMLAAGLLAWGSTEWRAQGLLSQRLPSAWEGQELIVEGTVQGLPTRRGEAWSLDLAVHAYEFEGQQWPVHRRTRVDGHHLPSRVALFWTPRWPSPTEPAVADDESGEVPDTDTETEAVEGAVQGPAAQAQPHSVPRAGQRWRFAVRLHRPAAVGNPGGFDLGLWLFERGVRATGQVRPRILAPLLLSSPGPFSMEGALDRWRQHLRESVHQHVQDPRLAGVLVGLTVGDQAAIDTQDWEVFRRTGVAHLVSISGAHVTLLGWMVGWGMSWLWRRSERLVHLLPAPRARLLAMVLVSLLYALLAGWGVPAQRTVCMMAVWALLRWQGQRWPWPLVLLLAAVMVTALDPWALHQAGFWLSFVAVGVLLACDDGLHRRAHAEGEQAPAGRWAELGRAGAALLRTQVLITVALAPLTVLFFHQWSAVGLLANLWAIPLFTLLITPLALLGIVVPALWSVGAWLVAAALATLSWMAHWPGALSTWSQPPAWLALAALLCAVVLVLPWPWRWRALCLPPLLVAGCLPPGWRLQAPPLVGQFVLVAPDVGQGGAVLVRTARHQLLFDTGPALGGSDAGQRVLLPMLATLGVDRLDELIVSHGDLDHVGGAAAILAGLPVARLRSSLPFAHPVPMQARAPGSRTEVLRCTAGQRWVWDEVLFEVLHPSAERTGRTSRDSPNAQSCVLRVQAKEARDEPGQGGVSALLTADIEARQEAWLIEQQPAPQGTASSLRSTVLLLPHHGSNTSSTEAFLATVQPEQTVVQAGARNAYGHPSPKVTARLAERQLAWVGSPACGAYVWRSTERAAAQAATLPAGQSLNRGQCWRLRPQPYWSGG